ncbi:hypothetical protein ACFSLT_29185 [Novosphingobium resinovorum]
MAERRGSTSSRKMSVILRGDRIQWRLVNHELGIRNAERGTVERIDGTIATIRWDRDARVQDLDLSVHRTWDHGYCETVYSAQSKTYDRVFVLAPVASSRDRTELLHRDHAGAVRCEAVDRGP